MGEVKYYEGAPNNQSGGHPYQGNGGVLTHYYAGVLPLPQEIKLQASYGLRLPLDQFNNAEGLAVFRVKRRNKGLAGCYIGVEDVYRHADYVYPQTIIEQVEGAHRPELSESRVLEGQSHTVVI